MGGSGPSGNYLRALVIRAFLSSCLIGLGPFIIIGAVVTHHGGVGVAVVIALVALYLLSSAAADCIKIQYVLKAGYWTCRDQTRIERSADPDQYWRRFLTPGLGIALKATGAVMLGYLALQLGHVIAIRG